MPYFRRYKKRPIRKGRKVVRRRYVKKTRVPRSFAAKVKKVIHRMAENKILSQSANNQTLAAPNSVTVVPFLNLLPALQQGTGQGQRVGNQVRLTKNILKGHIWLRDYSATTNPQVAPIAVKLFIVSWKYANVGSGLQPTAISDWSTFFQAGSSTSGFTGNLLDMERSVNSDVWTVHATRSFMLSTTGGFDTTLNYNPTKNQSPNGVICQPFSFNLAKYSKALKYNDNIAPSHPTNHNLYLVIATCQARGQSNGDTASYCSYSFNQDMIYEDL